MLPLECFKPEVRATVTRLREELDRAEARRKARYRFRFVGGRWRWFGTRRSYRRYERASALWEAALERCQAVTCMAYNLHRDFPNVELEEPSHPMLHRRSGTGNGLGDWLLKVAARELANPSLGNGETRGVWLVRPGMVEGVASRDCDWALENLVERGILEPVRYAPGSFGTPGFPPDPGRGCAAGWPPFPGSDAGDWDLHRAPARMWVYRVRLP